MEAFIYRGNVCKLIIMGTTPIKCQTIPANSTCLQTEVTCAQLLLTGITTTSQDDRTSLTGIEMAQHPKVVCLHALLQCVYMDFCFYPKRLPRGKYASFIMCHSF